MKLKHFVGLDVHCQFTQIAVVDESGRLIRQHVCPTIIPALVRVLESVGPPRSVALEEGPLADWLSRNLTAHADQVVVCDPRRNRLGSQVPFTIISARNRWSWTNLSR